MHEKILRLFTLANTGCCFLQSHKSDRHNEMQLDSIGVVMSGYHIEFLRFTTLWQDIGDDHVAITIYPPKNKGVMQYAFGPGFLGYHSNASVLSTAENELTKEQDSMLRMMLEDAVEQLLDRAENEIAKFGYDWAIKKGLMRKPLPFTQKEAGKFFAELTALKRESK